MSLEALMKRHQPAILALADGSVFQGYSIGSSDIALGEVVFNTAMSGYQEIITDLSYTDQIVTLTYPHIGNTGINLEDSEHAIPAISGLVISELSPIVSNWRASLPLSDYLKQHNIVAIAGIDTRRLTRLLRDKGALGGCIMAGVELNPEAAIRQAKTYPGLVGQDLAAAAGVAEPTTWDSGSWQLDQQTYYEPSQIKYHVVVYDFGVKTQILRLLVDRGCRVTLVPATFTAAQVMALEPDGVLLSNGPGDPAVCDYAITAIRHLLQQPLPMFGICLGFQLLALAYGAQTEKMKFGHHGANHPVRDEITGQVFITSQNHGFAVNAASLPEDCIVTHRSLFDGSLQGFKHREQPVFAFQGHPEASPGPHDIAYLFDRFIESMQLAISPVAVSQKA